MAASDCEKCGRRHLITYQVEPKETWRLMVQDLWRALCPSCFDGATELAGVRYHFMGMRAVPWSDKAEPARRYGRRRR
jgi:hypothetical protein